MAASVQVQDRTAIRHAHRGDIPKLATVERSAASLFRTVNLSFLADGPIMDPSLLANDIETRHLWVAVNSADDPVGFLTGYSMDSYFYIRELSVHADWQRKGIARRLIERMESQVTEEGLEYVTLTTYRDLDWNGKFYGKVGYVEVAADEVGKEHVKTVEEEGKHGYDLTGRCLMWKKL